MSIDAPTLPLGPAPGDARRLVLAPPRPAARSGGRTGAVGIGALAVLLVLSVAVVVVADDRPSLLSPPSHATSSFPSWMAGPLGGLLPAGGLDLNVLRWGFSAAIAVMYGAYLVVLRCAPAIRAGWAVAAVVALHVVFLLAPPLPFTDVFNYLNYGRMGFVHHLNPYTTIPALEPHTDPSFALSNWHHLLSPYGPLFTLLTYALAPLGVPAGYWVLKLVLALSSLGGLALLWRCAQMVNRPPVPVVLFVGVNPVVLVWGLGGDHNDFLMMTCILAGLYLLLGGRFGRRPRTVVASEHGPSDPAREGVPEPDRGGHRRAAGAGVALMAAVAIKASAGILAPVILAGARGRRWGLMAGAGVGAVGLGLATLLAFGPHLPDLAEQGSLVTGVGLPNLLGLALGLGGETPALHTVLSVGLVVCAIACTVWAWRTGDWLPAAPVAMLALLLTLSWELPWYVFWLLPLAALGRPRWLRGAALILGAYLILAWIPLTTDLIRGLSFRPTATPLGEQHTRLTRRLLH